MTPSWSKLGHLVSRMTILFSMLTNHQIRHIQWAASLVIIYGLLIFLRGIGGRGDVGVNELILSPPEDTCLNWGVISEIKHKDFD